MLYNSLEYVPKENGTGKENFNMEFLAEILEILMVVSFGASWPINARKAYKARTAKGTSPLFLGLILFGYVCGIASKFINIGFNIGSTKWYVVFFYILNLVVVSINLGIYFRNRALDAKNAESK